MDLLEILRIILGAVYLLFLPGFLLSLVFFKYKDKKISWIARIALSFVFSIVVVSVVVFLANLLGLAINESNVFLEVLFILIISIIYLILKR